MAVLAEEGEKGTWCDVHLQLGAHHNAHYSHLFSFEPAIYNVQGGTKCSFLVNKILDKV